MIKYEIHYEFFAEDENHALACHGLLELMRKFKIVVTRADISQSHVGDITLTVGYCYQKTTSLKSDIPTSLQP